MIKPAPGLSIEQQPEAVIVRLCLCDEARGEKDAGGDLDAGPMLAIWHVIRNRAMKRDGSLKAEVLRPMQFSGFNPEGGHREQMLLYWKSDPVSWTRADAVCDLAERGWTEDPTLGALNYYNPTTANPPWGRGHAGWKEGPTIGSHVFGWAA